jgi:hypothetical protein
MARRKRRQGRTADLERIGLHEAAILLEKLREMGHVTAAHVRDARHAVRREVDEIVARLARLKGMTHAPAASASAAEPAASRTGWRVGSRRQARAPISAERQRTMELQGRYLGLMHRIPARDLKKFKDDIPKIGKAEVVRRMEAYVRKHETKRK